MTEELPKELVEALKQKEKAQMKHNWMYSFMPSHENVYLVGYCKTCNNAFSSLVPIREVRISGQDIYPLGTLVTELDVPKWGCIPVQELAPELG